MAEKPAVFGLFVASSSILMFEEVMRIVNYLANTKINWTFLLSTCKLFLGFWSADAKIINFFYIYGNWVLTGVNNVVQKYVGL